MNKAAATGATTPRRERISAALYFVLHLAGFAGSTLVMTWGVFAIFFLIIGGFSLDGLMHQLANLSNRYLAADPQRIASFRQEFGAAHLLVLGALIALRARNILPLDRAPGGNPDV